MKTKSVSVVAVQIIQAWQHFTISMPTCDNVISLDDEKRLIFIRAGL
ncbi:hypothetical protein [Ginsengibacter hankyongi]|nr:hypothetical protein [Ginsengibacter hankyongi]